MTRNHEMKEVLQHTKFQLQTSTKIKLLFLIAVGVIAFIVALSSGYSSYAWQALLINTIFFTGLSYAGLMISVIFTVTDAHWGRPIKRFAEATASFIPFGTILFFILFFGAQHFFEWVDHDKVIHSKEAWLNLPFFIKRNIAMFLITGFLAYIYIKNSIRPDIGLAKSLLPSFGNHFAERFIKNYQDQTIEEQQALVKNKKVAPLLGFVYALLASLIGFDWMMSIDQEWFSTMFGVQHLVANLITAFAALLIITGIFRKKFKLEEYIHIHRYHDNAKMTFAACLLWSYMIFSQVIVIWYANIPEETPFLVLRMKSIEWGWMFWVIFVMIFFIPFFGLMSRTACRSIWFSRLIAINVLAGIWLEKYFLIIPSIQENNLASLNQHHLPGFEMGPFFLFLTLGIGMLGLFIYCYTWFLEKVPVIPVSDKFFYKKHH